MRTKYLPLRGTAIQYYHAGPSTLPDTAPDLSRGARVVLIHGDGGNGHAWRPVLSALGERHSPIAFDLPAHGRSGATEGCRSITAYADVVATLLEALSIGPCVLVGDSMGAAIAMAGAATQPANVRGLVSIGGALRFEYPTAVLDTWRNVMLGRTPQPFPMEQFSPKAEMPAIRATFMEQVKTDPRVRYYDLAACAEFDATPLLPALSMPALVIAGGDDRLVPRGASEQLQRELPNGRLAVIEDAGHAVITEQPTRVFETIEPFVSSL